MPPSAPSFEPLPFASSQTLPEILPVAGGTAVVGAAVGGSVVDVAVAIGEGVTVGMGDGVTVGVGDGVTVGVGDGVTVGVEVGVGGVAIDDSKTATFRLTLGEPS
jgi:hypothetical protein